jgi:MFS family permease
MHQQSVSEPSSVVAKERFPRSRYAWYVVILLTVIYVFSIIDRMIMNPLVIPIRRDLGISDTQISLLIGFGFAIFYTFLSVPLGRLADTWNRRKLIIIGIVVWSLMTSACGLAGTFTQFLILRMGVGVGEAVLNPSAFSLISDYFPREKRATPISVYTMAIFLGTGLASFLGGAVTKSAQGVWNLPIGGAIRSWQIIFIIVGLPGLLLAILMLTVKEPKRTGLKAVETSGGTSNMTLGKSLLYIRKVWVTLLCHNLGFALLILSGVGTGTWIVTFLVRKYGMTIAQAGPLYGFIIIIGGPLSMIVAGKLSDRLTKRGYRDSNIRVGLIVALAWIPTGILFPLMPTAGLAIALFIPSTLLAMAPYGIANAALLGMMPNPLRGQAIALYGFIANVIGLGFGPTAIALMTDYVFHSDQALNYSLLVVGLVAHLAAALLLWIAMRTYPRSLDHFNDWTGEAV